MRARRLLIPAQATLVSAMICLLTQWVTAEERPLVVKAWRGAGKPRDYETRILSRLKDFTVTRPVQYSRYGGWIGKKFEATGYFHPRKIDGRWWLIDPEGYRFLHVAVNGVAPGSSPQMKQALPLKFGTKAKWRDETAAMLWSHGFNGTGAWSDDRLFAGGQRRVVYTPSCNFMGGYGKQRGGVFQEPGHLGYPKKCVFAFDPEFETFAERHAQSLAELKDDPYLLGYFSDNELPFPMDSLDRYLSLAPNDAGFRAATTWLAQRRGNAEKQAPLTDEDREAWLGFVADRYFSVCARAIKKYDPNHLYLGSRFYGPEKKVASVWLAAGKHLDVVAVNVYGVWTPQAEMLRRWAEWSGRPILVTEWYAKGADSGLANKTGAGWTVATQQDRGRFYQNFTLGLLESKVCVGWHWFKYIDNDPTDQRTDPSNRDSNKGIVNVTYEPYRPLVDAMNDLNHAAYPLTEHFDREK